MAGRVARARLEKEGFYHIPHLRPADPTPGQAVTVTAQAGSHVTITDATLHYTVDGTDPIPDSATTSSVAMHRTRINWDTLTWSYFERWEGAIPGQANDTEVRYSISATNAAGNVIRCPHMPPPSEQVTEADKAALRMTWETRSRLVAPRVYAYVVDEQPVADWLRNAVIYQIFVDRFAPDPGKEFAHPKNRSGFYGGTLAGVRGKLDYLSDLGVDCLWLSPIFPAPSHHGYDATDYSTVEPRLGDLGEFEQLVHAAHERGIRIVLDYVANHISNEHPAFLAAQQSQDAETSSWFHFRAWPDDYDNFLGVRTMPRLVTDDPSARAYLIDNACAWLERGADGFRLDHAHGATHAFWSAFRRATRGTKPDSVMFGEVTDTPEYSRSYTGRMDGVLDFGLLEVLRKYFAFDTLTVSELDSYLRRHFAFFGDGLALPSFLDNHDMNRFLYSVDNDVRRLKLAALCQFTLPDPPIIYYGTEVGLSQMHPADPLEESRLPMLWGDQQNRDLLTYYSKLIALRRAGEDVWRGERNSLQVDDERDTYVYSIGVYVILLHSGQQTVILDLLGQIQGEAFMVLATSDVISFDQQASTVTLPPYSGCVLQLLNT